MSRTSGGQTDLAARWLSGLITDLARHTTPELRGMAHTLRRWCQQILAWHTTGVGCNWALLGTTPR